MSTIQIELETTLNVIKAWKCVHWKHFVTYICHDATYNSVKYTRTKHIQNIWFEIDQSDTRFDNGLICVCNTRVDVTSYTCISLYITHMHIVLSDISHTCIGPTLIYYTHVHPKISSCYLTNRTFWHITHRFHPELSHTGSSWYITFCIFWYVTILIFILGYHTHVHPAISHKRTSWGITQMYIRRYHT